MNDLFMCLSSQQPVETFYVLANEREGEKKEGYMKSYIHEETVENASKFTSTWRRERERWKLKRNKKKVGMWEREAFG